MISLLLACGTPAPPPVEPAPVPKPIVTKAIPVVHPEGKPVQAGGAVPIELQFDGVGDLHQRYFSDSEIVTPLAVGLGTCLSERAVLRISYDTERRIGRIRVFVDPKQNTCKPRNKDGAVDLSVLEPIGTALATYRDTLAARFDIRLASFRIDLEALSGTNLCRLDLIGQYPPDGTTWGSCVVLGGETVCAGDAKDGVRTLTLPAAQASHLGYLAACFH